MTYVIVDNNQNNLSAFIHLLRELQPDVQVFPFTDPLLAVKYIWNNPVNMVFVKADTRPINGYELLRSVRKQKPSLPIFLLSQKPERLPAAMLPVDGYLFEPITAEQLARAVDCSDYDAEPQDEMLK